MAKGAPKGNRFWELRSKHGRNRLFATPQLLWEAAVEYFEWCEDNPLLEAEQTKSPGRAVIEKDGKSYFPDALTEIPKMRALTIQGLVLYLDCNVKYFNDFENSLVGKDDELSKDFSTILSRIREVIYNHKFTGAAAGFLNPNIIARDLGLADRSEITGKGGAPLVPSVIINMPSGINIDLPSNTDGE